MQTQSHAYMHIHAPLRCNFFLAFIKQAETKKKLKNQAYIGQVASWLSE